MAPSQDSMAGMPIMTKPSLESSSCSFTDSKPRMMIKHDVKHTHVWTIGDIRKKIKMETGCYLPFDEFVGLFIVGIFTSGQLWGILGDLSQPFLYTIKHFLARADPDAIVDLVKNGDLVRLEHVTSRRNIHSHRESAPVSKRHFQVEFFNFLQLYLYLH